eukprot:CAMPEP_0183463448 /NCGR_PEP_ID=MMETSP0370-20130417/143577_1 /TAXON_ID=268820 /ORGANISM="Peridinium aciculiferum, Strain PAER-2" /LENGTH=134 /DNA_ID=CAMNT_0025655563 /DNA_START=56 /DNA_END=457 /DNA_ORIENTATION=+
MAAPGRLLLLLCALAAASRSRLAASFATATATTAAAGWCRRCGEATSSCLRLRPDSAGRRFPSTLCAAVAVVAPPSELPRAAWGWGQPPPEPEEDFIRLSEEEDKRRKTMISMVGGQDLPEWLQYVIELGIIVG